MRSSLQASGTRIAMDEGDSTTLWIKAEKPLRKTQRPDVSKN